MMDKITVLLDSEGYECSKLKDAIIFRNVKETKKYITDQEEPNNKFKIIILWEI